MALIGAGVGQERARFVAYSEMGHDILRPLSLTLGTDIAAHPERADGS